MTDISVMGEWQVAGVGGTRPLWNVLGEAIEGRFSFEAWNYLFSFQRYVRFEEFFLFPALLKDLAPNVQLRKAPELLVSTMFWGSFWKLRSATRHFLRTLTTTTSISWKFPFFFPKQSWFYLPDRYGDPKSEQSTLVMIRRKLEVKTRLPGVGEIERWTIDRRRDWYESCAVIHGPEEKKTLGSQRVIVRRLNPSSSTNQHWQQVLRSLFPDVATVSHFAVFVDVDVQQQDGQAAARGQRRKAVIRDISGVDHWGVTNLSAPIWFTGQRHCTVFRHVMQLSLLVLCRKSTLTVILPQVKKKRSLSNVGHRGTKAENLAWHSTG